jgi:hypothetical protein
MSKTCNDEINLYDNGYNYHLLFSYEELWEDSVRRDSGPRMKLWSSGEWLKCEIMVHDSHPLKYHDEFLYHPHTKPQYTYTPSITIFLKNSKMAIALGLVPLKKSRTKRSQKPT